MRRSIFGVGRIAFLTMLIIAAIPGISKGAEGRADEKTEVTISISDAFIPSGFDSGSDAFVVVHGMFPNTCYAWKEAVVTHNSDNEHEIRSIATVNQGICLMMLVPFSQEVQLGKLERGVHDLRFMNGDGTFIERQMTIE